MSSLPKQAARRVNLHGKGTKMDNFNKKVIASAIGSGVLAAGIGAAINRNRAAKKRQKALDANKSKNAIVIDINKAGFLKDLPTPTQLATERGEIAKPQEAAEVVAPKTQEATNPSVSAPANGTEMSPEEIAAAKKNILRNNGRKVDFFGKRASESKDDGENKGKEEKKNDKPIVSQEPSETSVKKIENKESKESTLPPRNELGQFTSKTDPTGVVRAEKEATDRNSQSAGEFGKNLFLHPLDTASGIWGGIKSHKPFAFAAGSVASLYLAAMIVDKINDMRSKKAKRDSESARNEYAKLLQSGDQEKAAGWEENIGLLAGGAVVVPAVFTAMIANKIMERRKAEKEKAKGISDSFPGEPVILYKTSEAKDIQITPETALTLFMLKKAMFEEEIVKEAQFGALTPAVKAVKDRANKIIGDLGAKAEEFKPYAELMPHYNMQTGELSDEGWKLLGSGKLNNMLYGIADGYLNNGGKTNIPFNIDKIKQDPRLLDIYANLFSSGDERAKQIQAQAVDKKLSAYFGNNGFGGWLKKIISWLANNTGIGGWFFRRNLKDNLAGALGTKFPEQPQAQNQSAGATAAATSETAK